MKKILAISTSPFPYHDNITDGPGYRAWHLFQKIAEKNNIVILSLYESYHLKLKNEFEIQEDNISIKCVRHSPRSIALRIEQENPDLLYLPWSSTPFLSRVKRKIPTIMDYVGAGLLEDYAAKGYIPITLLQMKLKSFWLGDFFLTAGQRERYYLIGLMAASKRLSLKKNELKRPSNSRHTNDTSPKPADNETKCNSRKNPGEAVLLLPELFFPGMIIKPFSKL